MWTAVLFVRYKPEPNPIAAVPSTIYGSAETKVKCGDLSLALPSVCGFLPRYLLLLVTETIKKECIDRQNRCKGEQMMRSREWLTFSIFETYPIYQ